MSLRLTLEDVREILRLLDESPYDELTLETDELKVAFRRTGDNTWTQETHTGDPDRSDDKASIATAVPAAEPDARHLHDDGQHNIRAPLPGTFYRAPKPDAEPFVEVGSSVDENTVVAIIETMKLMNSVTAGCTGEIVEICVANGEMVENGAVLARVKAGSE